MVKHSTIASPSSDYTITYGGDSDYMTDTGTEYTFNTDSMMNDDGTITLNGVTITFGANGYDEMIISKDITYYTFCEHHNSM